MYPHAIVTTITNVLVVTRDGVGHAVASCQVPLEFAVCFLPDHVATPTSPPPQMERRNISPSRSQVIHIVHLKRFTSHSDSFASAESFQKHFCSLLAAAPHRALSLAALSEKLVSVNMPHVHTTAVDCVNLGCSPVCFTKFYMYQFSSLSIVGRISTVRALAKER